MTEKQELLQLHQLLGLMKHYYEHETDLRVSGRFRNYQNVETSPINLDANREKHKEAVFALLKDLPIQDREQTKIDDFVY